MILSQLLINIITSGVVELTALGTPETVGIHIFASNSNARPRFYITIAAKNS